MKYIHYALAFVIGVGMTIVIITTLTNKAEENQDQDVASFIIEDHVHDEGGNHVKDPIENDESGIEVQEISNETVIALVGKEFAYGNAVITTDASYRYIMSNGLPEHLTGQFPNAGNPNSISEQDHSYKVTLQPVHSGAATAAQLPGVALNGIPLEPGTAEFFNNDRSSGWSEEAFYNGIGGLGIDWSNAHVQPDGTYHYHGLPEGLLGVIIEEQLGDVVQVGWAADGFPIYYSLAWDFTSSYRVKEGVRPGGPGGTYDGKYTQDYEYVDGLGNLDECNGTYSNGRYGYYITKSFPFINRCLYGTPDSTFQKGPQNAGNQNERTGNNAQAQGGAGSGQPPQEAISACAGKAQGNTCSVETPQGSLNGSCLMTPNKTQLACVPNR